MVNDDIDNDEDEDTRRTEIERIPLHEYTTKDEIHELFHIKLGFTFKSKNDQEQVLNIAQQNQYNERLQNHIRIEYYKWRTIYVDEFRTKIIGIASIHDYEQQIQQINIQLQQCRRGPIYDYLYTNYDHINLFVAGAYQSDRKLYAIQYLQKLETTMK